MPPLPTDPRVIQANEAASQILFELSGRRFAGVCTATARPCSSKECFGACLRVGPPNDPFFGLTTSASLCCCIRAVTLAGYPIQGITTVRIDGAVVPPTDYRVLNGRDLVRNDGGDWPDCQIIELPDTEPGTFSVEYVYGQDPGPAGRLAAITLACELLKLCFGTGDCNLPINTSSVTRLGATIETAVIIANWRLGQTGIWAIDAFLQATPNERMGAVMSPDLRYPHLDP